MSSSPANANADQDKVPDSFICALTHDLMADPVIDPEGHTYDRPAIEKWLETHNTSPITRSPLSLSDLVPNRALRDSIEQWLQTHQNAPRHPAAASTNVASPPPLPVGAPGEDEEEITMTITASVRGTNDIDVPVLVSLKPPIGKQRTPIDICCVIDNSGSMGEEATVHNQSGNVERHGLSLLDIVKHAVKTIIRVMTPADRLAIVSFSDTAKIEFTMAKMDTPGKKNAEKALDALAPDCSTNLWDGLQTGLNVLRTNATSQSRTSAVLLLTDGQPNIIPPRGHLPMLQKYKDQYSLNCTINTFGFGYNLDSKLLEELAIEGHGSYAFIPDSNFVGTTFVHFTSNLLSTLAKNLTLTLETLNDAKILDKGVLGGHPTQYASWGAQLQLGQMQFGQTKDIVVRMSMPNSATQPYLAASLTYNSGRTNSPIKVATEGTDRLGSIEVDVQRLRLLFVDRTREAMALMSTDNAKARDLIKKLAREIKDSEAKNDNRIAALLKDVEGQVMEALSRADWFKKWGVHYLPSLMRAHLLQQCNNFKDPGVQVYGSPLFSNLRDQADDIFCKLPPPKPSSASAQSRPAVTSMSRYNYSGNPCFGGDCQVLMADQSLKRVKQIVKGDRVLTPSAMTASAEVLCVVKTHCAGGKAQLVELDGGLVITPWHPLCIFVDSAAANTGWQFPCEVKPAIEKACPAVYSFVLSGGHVMVINGVHCVTLGHNFKGDKREHAYFGSNLVVDDLRKLAGWDSGLVELNPGCLVRDTKTGLVCKLVNTHVHEAVV